MSRKRIQVYADSETKRRIELAAAKSDIAVTEYCLEAIRDKLLEDDVLEQEQIEIPIRPKEGNLIAELHALREKIKARRGGSLIDLDIVNETRQERDNELISGLH